MPYTKNTDPPPAVKEHLPAHAQDTFRAAFNLAFDEYHHDEERAFRTAWAAVEHKYEKDAHSGQWKIKEEK